MANIQLVKMCEIERNFSKFLQIIFVQIYFD